MREDVSLLLLYRWRKLLFWCPGFRVVASRALGVAGFRELLPEFFGKLVGIQGVLVRLFADFVSG
jgi:hypothetical protein